MQHTLSLERRDSFGEHQYDHQHVRRGPVCTELQPDGLRLQHTAEGTGPHRPGLLLFLRRSGADCVQRHDVHESSASDHRSVYFPDVRLRPRDLPEGGPYLSLPSCGGANGSSAFFNGMPQPAKVSCSCVQIGHKESRPFPAAFKTSLEQLSLLNRRLSLREPPVPFERSAAAAGADCRAAGST